MFLIDLVVQRRIVPDYLHRRRGRIDTVIVIVTFPFYLLPGATGYSAILVLARLARVARVLVATAGMRRFAQRLGKSWWSPPRLSWFARSARTRRSTRRIPAMRRSETRCGWGIVTLTTVGYGDIVPKTTAGRLCGVAIMYVVSSPARSHPSSGSEAQRRRTRPKNQSPGRARAPIDRRRSKRSSQRSGCSSFPSSGDWASFPRAAVTFSTDSSTARRRGDAPRPPNLVGPPPERQGDPPQPFTGLHNWWNRGFWRGSKANGDLRRRPRGTHRAMSVRWPRAYRACPLEWLLVLRPNGISRSRPR